MITVAKTLETVLENELLLHQFVKETIGYLLLMVIQEFEKTNIHNNSFDSFVKLAIDVSDLMFKLSEGNKWLFEQTLNKRICIDESGEACATVSVEALMTHVHKRDLLMYLINNSR